MCKMHCKIEMDREQELISMEKNKENERRQKLEDVKTLCNKENILIRAKKCFSLDGIY